MKNLTMQMKMSLLIVTVILFVLIAVGIVNTSEMKTTIEAENKARLSQIYDLSVYNLDQALPGEWHLKNGELYKGDAKIAEETALIDKLGELSHAAITIFAQDTRVNTNIQVDGQRAIGTTADPKVTEAVLTQGSLYKGAADVVGKPYFTQYGPYSKCEWRNDRYDFRWCSLL
ncbi:Methyl-accepting chemotaxis protein OS=Lysinibacillus sphaericus OX=1421 GN=LS41612_15800 PE=3 SV=1 [Lysinibacillus sphaericus]